MFLFDVSCVCRFEHVGTRDHEHVVNMLLLVVAHFVCLTFRRRSHLVSLWEDYDSEIVSCRVMSVHCEI